jgi:hypothetical protein
MKFDIGIWWHWLFIAFATLGSAYNACRVFFAAYAASRNPFFIPFFQFFYELAGSFAGWMSLWYLLPLVFRCSGADCDFKFSWLGVCLLAVAVLGIFGRIPSALNHLAEGISRLVSPSA